VGSPPAAFSTNTHAVSSAELLDSDHRPGRPEENGEDMDA